MYRIKFSKNFAHVWDKNFEQIKTPKSRKASGGSEFPLAIPIAPKIVPNEIETSLQSTTDAIKPPPSSISSVRRDGASSISSLQPIIPLASKSTAPSDETSETDSIPEPTPSNPSRGSSWFGRIKGSLRKLQRKNYKI